ncbi:MAG: asparaginase [Planctomycetes bacterium]|nr:asparaginase [Planctomycetota bacterium]MCB9902574.1 asparaginase [Planctomycetota bacterium]
MSGQPPPAAIFVRLFRAGRPESLHRGHLLAIRRGQVVASAGDPHHLVFVRSAAKPVQALTGITSGAVEGFGMDDRCVAISCASHMARPEHLAAAQAILDAAHVPHQALGCGGHYSFDPDIARLQHPPPEGPPAIWSNCSGKHAMMLAAARAMGAPLEHYTSPGHPVQRSILADLLTLAQCGPDELVVAIDGCSAPAPALPLDRFGRVFQSLLEARRDEAHPLHDAASRVLRAMAAHPDLIAGPGRFDTDLMLAGQGRIVAKAGAEGVHITLVPDEDLLIAAKVEDGIDRGYRGVIIELLERLGVFDETTATMLRTLHADPVIRNWAGEEVGALVVEAPPVRVPAEPDAA